MTEKFTPGQRWHPPTAADHNLIADAAEDYRARILGVGGNPARLPPIPTDMIKVRNSSGAQRRAGEVLEADLRGLLMTDVTATHLWIDANIPSGLVRWGILRKTLPDGEIGELQLSGVCKALVDIQDTSDRRAGPVVSSAVLKSGSSGPLKLLYAPASTGEQECIVQFDAATLPRAFFYDGGVAYIAALNTTYTLNFTDQEWPAGASSGSVTFDAANDEWQIVDGSKWALHAQFNAQCNYPLAAGRIVHVQAWIAINTAIPSNPGMWGLPNQQHAHWVFNDKYPPNAYDITASHHVVPYLRSYAGRKYKVFCSALSNIAGSFNATVSCTLNWQEIANA